MQIDGETFAGSTSEIVPGKFVSFRYTGRLQSGAPINPKIYCTRDEVTAWAQILHSKKLAYQQIWKPSLQTNDWKNVASRRQFFDSFAASKGFDPSDAGHWYDHSHELRNVTGCAGVLQYYNNSVINALMDVYDNIGLKRHLFKSVPRNYWADKQNQKKFFEDFAAENSFDPREKTYWYMLLGKLQESKGISGLRHYGTPIGMLMEIYPDIGLSKKEFKTFPGLFWRDSTNRVQLFKEFATDHHFDPAVAQNWANHESLILSDKRFYEMSKYTDPILALFTAFPKIGLKPQLFKSLSANYWEDVENQKQFFMNFAAKKNFDPNVAENWYTSRGNLQNTKGYPYIRNKYGTVENALLTLFPDIGLIISKFPARAKQ